MVSKLTSDFYAGWFDYRCTSARRTLSGTLVKTATDTHQTEFPCYTYNGHRSVIHRLIRNATLKRCKHCNAPLTITGTHCNRCQAPRDDIEEQHHERRKRDIVTTFLVFLVGSFFSLTLLLWFAGCAVIGVGLGCVLYSSFGINIFFCSLIGCITTFFVYAFTWFIFIYL